MTVVMAGTKSAQFEKQLRLHCMNGSLVQCGIVAFQATLMHEHSTYTHVCAYM